MKNKYHTIDVVTPFEGAIVVLNTYWLCKDGDPKQAIFFGTTAQCNKSEAIVDKYLQYTRDKSGWNVEIVFLEIAYRLQPKEY